MAVQKDLVAGLYDRASPIYDHLGTPQFSRFGDRLAELMAIKPGARVLDVGVGRGANLFPAAERVGATGAVVGIDISPGMLREVDAEIRSRAIAQASVTQMDGEALAFPDASFDCLMCGYTIFWFGDLLQALKGFHRVLAVNGLVGVSMFAGGDPRWAWYEELLQQYNEAHVGFTGFGGNNINGKPDILRDALLEAGFDEVHIEIEPFEIVHPSAQAWWEEKWAHGSRAPLEQMTAEVRTRFQKEVLARLPQMAEDGVYRTQWQTCFALAHKRAPDLPLKTR